MKKALTIADLKHRVAFCSMQDVVTEGNEMRLSRKDVYHAWVKIEAKKPSQFSPSGFNINEPRQTQTHMIYARYRRDLDISSAAWIYEERLQSAPRWYKILSVKDDCEMWCFSCRLIERSDEAQPPTVEGECEEKPFGVVPLPQGINL